MMESAYDGKTARRRGDGTLDIISPAAAAKANWVLHEYTLYAGLVPPGPITPNPDWIHRLLQDPPRDPGEQRPQFLGWEVVESDKCAVLGLAKGVKVWLDPARNYAMRRHEVRDVDSGLLAERRVNASFLQPIKGVWLPDRCILDRYASHLAPPGIRGRPLVRHKLTVKTVRVNNVADSLFTLSARPGSLVSDATALEPDADGTRTITYAMPAQASELDRVIADATAFREEHSGRVSGWLVAAYVGAAGVLLLVVAMWLRRMRKIRARHGAS
jgi:hypothetical protein